MEILSNEKYTSKIIKAGALIDDTKTMLANWDISQPVKANLFRLHSENIFGKATRSRIEDILVIFRQRYLNDPNLIRGLLLLIDHPRFLETVDRILFFFAAQNDRLLYDAATIFLVDKQERGIEEISTEMVMEWIQNLVAEGKTTTTWSEHTIHHCSRNILSTLRDFGILQGANLKRIAPFHLPLEAFAFIAFYKYQKMPSGERLIHDNEWKLFFLSEKTIERYLMEAHQNHLLEYYVAGSVIRLTFPVDNLEEYARVISQRTY